MCYSRYVSTIRLRQVCFFAGGFTFPEDAALRMPPAAGTIITVR